MDGLAQALDALLKQGILPAAFIIGTIAFFIALIGKIPTGNGHDILPIPRFFLGLFGFVFAFAGLGGALLGIFAVTNDSTSNPMLQVVTATPDFAISTRTVTLTPVLSSNCNLETPLTPLNSNEIIPGWRDSEIVQLSVNIPAGYDTLYVSSDPAIFNGLQSRERLIILSHSNLQVEELSFNLGDGHFNIWVVAFVNCSNDQIFERYGLDGTNLVWLIDQQGQRTQYYP